MQECLEFKPYDGSKSVKKRPRNSVRSLAANIVAINEEDTQLGDWMRQTAQQHNFSNKTYATHQYLTGSGNDFAAQSTSSSNVARYSQK